MKVDTHVHTLPVSRCATKTSEELPAYFAAAGVDAFVLTNHYYPHHCNFLSEDLAEQARLYLDAFYRCREAGKACGVGVYFGCEVKLIHEPHTPEFLLIGISEELFLKTYPLYEKSQKELFDFCNEHDILIIQAHPFRAEQGYEPADTRYMHGVEVHNSQFIPHPEETHALAKAHGLMMTAGSDLHRCEQAGMAYMVVPDTVCDQFTLRDALKHGPWILCDQNGVMYHEETL